MIGYIINRLLWFVPVVLVTLTLLFLLFQVVPGDPIRAAFGQEVPLSDERVEQLRAELGLDQPLHTRYLNWLWGLLQGDLGTSFFTAAKVSDQLKYRIPVTLGLAGLAMLILMALSIPLGTLSGYYHDRWPDLMIRPVAIFFIGIPHFWLATIMILILLTLWHTTVPIKYVTFFTDPWGALRQYALPALVLALRPMGVATRIIRSAVIEVFEEDYIRTARSKGIAEKFITIRHALPNSLIPAVTYYGLEIITLVGATVIIETIFGIPGIGSMVAQAAISHDITVLQGGIMVLLLLALVVNLAVDLLYARLDPRVRYEK